MSKPANPPAFPMTIRDWFAGQAVPPVAQVVIEAGRGPDPEADAERIAIMCFMVADALLSEREKGAGE